MGDSAGSSSVQAAKRLCKLAPASFPRPRTAAPTGRRRGVVHLLSHTAYPSSGEGREEGHVDGVTAAALEPASDARSQQPAATSSREPWHASPGLHGGRGWQLAEARSARCTWRPPVRRQRPSDRSPLSDSMARKNPAPTTLIGWLDRLLSNSESFLTVVTVT